MSDLADLADRAATSPAEVSVCVATFRRPVELRRLLETVAASVARTPSRAVEVVIVDNDREEGARAVVEAVRSQLPAFAAPAALVYAVEGEQNIARARNRAVSLARADWIAFVDDDEVVSPEWLAEYLEIRERAPADGYFGRVIMELAPEAPAWLDAERFFPWPRPVDGAEISFQATRTTNLFLRRELFLRYPFDPAYGLTGGSDTEVFARMVDCGARFRWSDRAVTTEYVPASRTRLRWLLQRAFRYGATYTRIDRARRPGAWASAERFARAVVAVALYTLMLPVELCLGRRPAAWRLYSMALQLGHLWALIGRDYEEYRSKR